MLFALITSALSLSLRAANSNFVIVGTPTSATFTFDNTAMPTWTLLFGSNGIDTVSGVVAIGITVDSSGMWTVYQDATGAAVTKIATSATSLPSSTTAVVALTELAAALPSGKSFPWTAGRVYSLCVYPALGFTTLASTITPVCGTYHTMTNGAGSDTIDRNMGKLSKSWTVTGGTGNSYTQTIYSDAYTLSSVSTLNFGVVFYSTGTVTAFEMWSSLGINNVRMVNQDQFLLGKSNTIVDGFSTSRSNSAVKADSTISCTDNAVLLSAGKSAVSGNIYQYWHGSRPYTTGDSSCDTDITASTSLCNVYLEAATLTDLIGDHGTGMYCANIFSQMLVPALLAVAATLI